MARDYIMLSVVVDIVRHSGVQTCSLWLNSIKVQVNSATYINVYVMFKKWFRLKILTFLFIVFILVLIIFLSHALKFFFYCHNLHENHWLFIIADTTFFYIYTVKPNNSGVLLDYQDLKIALKIVSPCQVCSEFRGIFYSRLSQKAALSPMAMYFLFPLPVLLCCWCAVAHAPTPV